MEVGGGDCFEEGDGPCLRLAAEEADDPSAELLAPDGQSSPSRPCGAWAPGLAASALLGPRVLRHAEARGPALLRDLVAAGEVAEAEGPRWQAGQQGVSLSTGGTTLLAIGLLVMLLRWPSRGHEPPGAAPEHVTELAIECTKVACVGASITRGNVTVYGGELASNAPYPKQLQSMLGPGYCVENFGVPGATVLKQSREPYWNQSAFSRIISFLPDIVVIQFGANDSREKNFEQDFRKDYASIIAFFRSFPSRPQVYIMAMPPIYPGTATKDGIPGKMYGMDADRLDNLRVPLNLIAKENGLSPPITVLNAFKKHCPETHHKCDWMSSDGVHPNRKGDKAMARLVHLTVLGDDLCTTRSADKEPCGDLFNFTEASCKERGCCYTPDSAGAPWCFQKKRAQPARPEECLASHDEKTDCGFEGDTMAQCLARGCCYKPSLDGTPWCFHRLQPMHPVIHAEDDYVRRITSTSWTTTVTTTTTATATTTTTMTFTGTLSSSTYTTTTTSTEAPVATFQAERLPLWLAVGGLGCLSVVLLFLLLRSRLLPQKEEKQQPQQQQQQQQQQAETLHPKGTASLDARKFAEDEDQRQLRRLQVDRVVRTTEKKRVDIERRRSTRELLTMLSNAGFTGVNEAKTKRGLFRVSYSYPLHAAVEANNPEAVRLLLHSRADPTMEDSRKRTPLALAEQLNKRDSHADCIAALSVGEL